MSHESTDAKRLAGDIEVTAKEIVAAANLYRTMMSGQDSLAMGLGSLVDRLGLQWKAFILTIAKEPPHASR